MAENSHKKEHDAMLHRLTVSEGEISGATSGMEESFRERDKVMNNIGFLSRNFFRDCS